MTDIIAGPATPTPGPISRVKKSRLAIVAASQGMEVEAMLEHFHTDSVVPGICVRCDTIVDSCEPDARDNWCDECSACTVKSILVLAGII